MIKANYHTHTIFCDGGDQPEDYLNIALEKKLTAIGFSAHVPLPIANNWSMRPENFSNYLKELDHLKSVYSDRIEIYTGLEMDYLPTENPGIIAEYLNKVDYSIGAVHYLYDAASGNYYEIDGNLGEVDTAFKAIGRGDNRRCVAKYFQELTRVVIKYRPNILGHLDIIKKHNREGRYFDEHDEWYHDLVDELLVAVSASGTIIELNTGGMVRDLISQFYPADWILKKCLAKNIPVVISTDAHQAKDLDGCFDEAASKLKQLGFNKQTVLLNNRWQEIDW